MSRSQPREEDKGRKAASDSYVQALRDIGASEVVIAAAEGRTEDVKRLWEIERRLNAPPGYRWTDEDVIYEKNQSVLNGLVIGVLIGCLICVLFVAAIR